MKVEEGLQIREVDVESCGVVDVIVVGGRKVLRRGPEGRID